jgi:hypothetical protein
MAGTSPAMTLQVCIAIGISKKIDSHQQPSPRHARPRAGHPRLWRPAKKSWMAGTSPAMTDPSLHRNRHFKKD